MRKIFQYLFFFLITIVPSEYSYSKIVETNSFTIEIPDDWWSSTDKRKKLGAGPLGDFYETGVFLQIEFGPENRPDKIPRSSFKLFKESIIETEKEFKSESIKWKDIRPRISNSNRYYTYRRYVFTDHIMVNICTIVSSGKDTMILNLSLFGDKANCEDCRGIYEGIVESIKWK